MLLLKYVYKQYEGCLINLNIHLQLVLNFGDIFIPENGFGI